MEVNGLPEANLLKAAGNPSTSEMCGRGACHLGIKRLWMFLTSIKSDLASIYQTEYIRDSNNIQARMDSSVK